VVGTSEKRKNDWIKIDKCTMGKPLAAKRKKHLEKLQLLRWDRRAVVGDMNTPTEEELESTPDGSGGAYI